MKLNKFAVVAATAVLGGVLVVGGCAKKTRTASASALDITPPPTPVYAPPQPVAQQPTPVAQPVVYDTQPVQGYAPATPQAQGGFGAGGSYTVKKGDTLFGIAKSRYGNGNQWQRIAAANPGLTPQNLKAGQTITLPN